MDIINSKMLNSLSMIICMQNLTHDNSQVSDSIKAILKFLKSI